MPCSPHQQREFDDWRDEANAVGLIGAWAALGHGTLKRTGKEHVGPCPACGGRDRLGLNPSKNAWNCRGAGGGHDAISLAMHIGGLTFLEACEKLSGRPCPTGAKAKPLSEEERAAQEKRRADAIAAQKRREADLMRYQEDTKEAAERIWNESLPFQGTAAETYLESRGFVALPADLPIRFHPSLPYPERGRMPALVCRVDDVAGYLTAIWRIYLRADGSGKADVPNAKLGLGPAGGGAVRIGGIGPRIAIAEGVESALGYWFLTGRRYPCWAALSTSGMVGIELPLSAKHMVIVPDGDRAMVRKGDEYVPGVPAGRKAAQTLRNRLFSEKVSCTIAAEPAAGVDYADLWLRSKEEVA